MRPLDVATRWFLLNLVRAVYVEEEESLIGMGLRETEKMGTGCSNLESCFKELCWKRRTMS